MQFDSRKSGFLQRLVIVDQPHRNRQGETRLKAGPLPALIFLAVAAGGLVVTRDRMAGRTSAAAEAVRDSALDSPGEPAGGRTAALRKEPDGHYWTTARVNGTPVRFMVDTGASVIVLTERDARRVGLDLDALPRNAEVTTASGRVRAAVAMLDEVTVDRVEIARVEAVVIVDGLEQSLLGMSFLNRLDGWEVTSRAIVIRQ